MQGLNLSQPGLKHDPHWFRTAVFYEVLVAGLRATPRAPAPVTSPA